MREGTPSPRDRTPSFNGRKPILLALVGVLALVAFGLGYWWFVQRIEVGPDQLVVLVRKIGVDLPDTAEGQVVLYPGLLTQLGDDPKNPTTAYKGIVYEPLAPGGRYFKDPFFWDREIVDVTQIKENEVGILIRKFGAPLPAGQVVADRDADQRGPVRGVLPPGRHNINLLAYDVKRVPPVVIPPGSVGVQALRSGATPKNPNDWIVQPGETGVQPDVLPPGLVYNNPYERHIEIVDITRHTLDFRKGDSIEFPSKDSFTIKVEATVEYAIRQDKVAYVLVAIGDHPEIVTRIILPYMKSLLRIEGSKLEAREFIGGESRTAFQNKVFEEMRRQCWDQGIEISAALLRQIEVPQDIAGPIADRQFADQDILKYQSQIKVAKAESLRAVQQEMQKQNQEIGEANRAVVAQVVQAEQEKSVAITDASKRLEVAKLKLEAARETAAQVVALGKAEAEVMMLDYRAKAEPLTDAVAAFGGGDVYAQYFFYQKLAPALKSVLDSTDGPLADIFRSFNGLAPSPARPRSNPAAGESAGRDTGVAATGEKEGSQ
ncbi:MAG: hypothetical protein AMXMBFR47_31380 [Planctomycetota bacterium]